MPNAVAGNLPFRLTIQAMERFGSDTELQIKYLVLLLR